MSHKPGRATDAAVHKALWPDDKVYCARENGINKWKYARPGVMGAGYLPRYTTSLEAWDGVGDDECEWRIYFGLKAVSCNLYRYEGGAATEEHSGSLMITARYADHHDNRHEALAYVQSLCVLWAERSGE